MKIKDLKIRTTTATVKGNKIKPTNPYKEFKKEDIYQSVPERFQQQVRLYGDKTAVKTKQKELSYDALNRSANRVAYSLMENYDDSLRLNRNEKSRYSRQMMLHNWGIEAQEKLKGTTVFCAGAGGSGSPLIMQLALSGFGKIIICDFDEVELSNLNRQVLHDESRIDMNKARSAAKTVKRINPNVEVMVYEQKITRETMCQMAEGADIVFDNVDDMEAKFIISQYCVDKQVPHIISSMIDMNCYAAVFHTPHTACFHCINDRGILQEVAEIKRLVSDYKKNPNPVSAPALFLCTGFAVNEAIKIVIGLDSDKPAYNKYFFFNQRGAENIVHSDAYRLITYAYNRFFRDLSLEQGCDWDDGWKGGFMDEINLRHNPDCPACGASAKLDPLPEAGTPGTETITPLNLENEPEFQVTKEKLEQDNDITDALNLKTTALLFQHGADMIVGIMGILKAGNVYVPLDPGYPEERLDYMLQDSEARMIVTNDLNYDYACRLRDGVNKHIKIINIDDLEREAQSGQMDPAREENPGVDIQHSDVAYVLYTSGSTGKPKGVMQSHRNVLHFGRVYTNALHLNADDRISLFSTYGFDAAKMDIYGALLNGGTLYPYDIKEEDNLTRMADWLREEGITIYHSIPTVYRYFTDTLTQAGSFPAIRFIVLGGEAVFKRDIDAFKEFFNDNCLFINGLGPTESTVTIQYFMDKKTEILRGAVPVGFAVDETEVLLLDENDKETMGTGVGEIVYKSDYLALGYLNLPVKTKEVFVPNPVTGKDRVYRSGDLGRRLMDGSIEYAGRKDFQVKIRGYRVELGEIEGRLDNVAGIKKSAVVCQQDTDGENFLTAYYVLSDTGGQTAEVDEMMLVAHLQEAVPDYMIPGAFYHLEEFPLTATGKIDRKVLSSFKQTESRSQVEFIPPSGPVETALAEIWKELLGIDKVGVHDNFFVLGGHSLKATLLVSRIHKNLGVKMPLPEVFKLRTVHAMAQYVAEASGETYSHLEKAPEAEYYPLSSVQKRLFVVQQLDNSGAGYNLPSVVELEGELDVERLEKTFQEMVARHESFRTAFVLVDDEPRQKIHPSVDFKLSLYDASSQEEEEKIIREFIRPFNMEQPPLLRAGLIRAGNKRFVLVTDQHHIISDGISIVLFIKEFMALYSGETLPPLTYQYKDFCYWRNSEEQREAVAKQEKFWLDLFADEVPVLELPYDYARPAVQRFEGNTLHFQVGTGETGLLKEIVREEGVTLYMMLLALVNIWLAKLSRQEDVVVGTPISGRRHSDLERVIGMFVNTLALRNFPAARVSFKDFVNQVKEQTLQAFENQDYQFEDLVDNVTVNRDMSRNPIFDVTFRLRDLDLGTDDIPRVEIGELALKPYTYRNQTAKFDLSVMASETPDGLSFAVEYAEALFSEETVQRFIGFFNRIVSQVVSQPSQLMGEISMMSEEEREQVLFAFNDTHRDYPGDRTIGELFREQVRRNPEQTAVIGLGGESMTYDQLNRRSNRLAHTLRQRGVTADDAVAVKIEPSLDMMVVLMAILKSGGAYLPIALDFPPERIRYMLADTGASLFLAPARFRDDIPQDTGINILDTDNEANYRSDTGDPELINGPGNLAYIIYTSGTTGIPKGVLTTHANVIRVVRDNEYIDITPGDRILQLSNYAFDGSVFDIYGALLNGAGLVMVGGEEKLEVEQLAALIKREKVTVFFTTTALFNTLVDIAIDCFDGVRKVLFGGERISVAHSRKALEAMGKDRIIHVYGPTETTVYATYYFIDHIDAKRSTIPIGRPLSNTAAYVLDAQMRPVPIGVPGILYIGGAGTARGYLNNPEMTADKFPLNPFVEDDRLYDSGDLVRRLADGNIEFLGRVDQQVKIRGFRIEPGEIESRLISHESVKEAVVLVLDNAAGDRYLCAYVVPAATEGTGPAESEDQKEQAQDRIDTAVLKSFLSATLPDYMVPAIIMPLEKMPLNRNGKVDRAALPEPDAGMGDHYVAPANETEETLVALWSEILALSPETIGVETSFFQLGGHSLKAAVLASKIHKQLQVKIPLTQLFSTPTIRGIAQYVQGADHEGHMAIEKAEEKDFYPLSAAQKRMYILQQMDPNSHGYNISAAAVLEGKLDVDKLQGAFRELVRRHESFRTSFTMIDGEPRQKIHTEINFDVECFAVPPAALRGRLCGGHQGAAPPGPPVALRAADGELREGVGERSEAVEGIVKAFVRPHDLTKAPLLRVGLIEEDPQRHVLVIDMHHIISDGVSLGIFIGDFMTLYNGTPLPPVTIQYKDFSQWQNRFFQTDGIRKQEEWWLDQFAEEVPALELPTDFVRPAVQDFSGDNGYFEMDKDNTARLKAKATDTGSTLFMVLTAVYNILLSKLSNSEDVVIGTPIAGRRHADLDRTVGMFVNSLALRHFPQGNKTFETFLEEVKTNTLQAFENQDYPFEELVEHVAVNRDTGRNPLFDTMLSLQNTDLPAISITGLNLKPFPSRRGISKFDLTLFGVEGKDQLSFRFEYCTKLFKAETIDRFGRYFNKVARSVIQDPNRLIRDIDILSHDEREQVLVAFNDTHSDYPGHRTIADLFQEQVERNPQQTAVIGLDRRTMSYDLLNQRSNRLAHTLRQRGVTADAAVAVKIEPSLDMMVVLMAILKSGGAYLPIALDFPTERVRYMLADTRTQLFLTTAQYRDEVPEDTGVGIIDIDDEENYSANTENPEPVNGSHNLAYIIYTSGTTGTPKGVLTTHANVIRVVRNNEYIDITPEDRILQLSNYAFDGSVFDIYGAFLNGAGLVLVGGEEKLEVEQLAALIKREKVTIFFVTTALFNTLVDIALDCFEGIRKVLFGGERISVEHSRKALEKMGKGRIIHVYGPTETTVYATYYFIDRIDATRSTIPIGRPLSNTTAYVLDAYMNPVPIGVPGVLYIGGAGTARGYLNNPQMTAEKFPLNPFVEGDHLYDSGDLVRRLPDGNIEFMGRVDHQVKIRGFRIELGEIENRLIAFDTIKEAVVLALESAVGDRFLCAYVVPSALSSVTTGNGVEGEEGKEGKGGKGGEGGEGKEELMDTAALKSQLSETMPDYMVPAFIIPLEKMPLNRNGKVDFRALPEPAAEAGLGREYIAPSNDLEQRLVDLWSDILGIPADTIGVETPFFEVGGHSLKATILVSRIHQAFQVKMPLTEVFKLQTVRALTKWISEAGTSAYESIEPVEPMDGYPLSYNQKRLWMLQQTNPGDTTFNMPGGFLLAEEVDVELFKKCLHMVAQRHEAFRTSFRLDEEKNEPLQDIAETVEIPLDVEDLCHLDEDGQWARRKELARLERTTPFDLTRPPLFRARLLKLAPNRWEFLYNMHHIVSDGWSQEVLKKDFTRYYEALASGLTVPSQPLPLQYKDFAAWNNSQIQDPQLKERAESFWLNRLEQGVPDFHLLYDGGGSEKETGGVTYRIAVDNEVKDGLKKMAADSRTTLFVLMFSIFNWILARFSGSKEVVCSIISAGRDHQSLQDIVGYFINSLLSVQSVDFQEDFHDFLARMDADIMELFQVQGYPLELLLTEMKRLHPNVTVSFNMLNILDDAAAAEATTIEPTHLQERGDVKFNLALHAVEYKNALEMRWIYKKSLFKPQTIEFIATEYIRLLEAVALSEEEDE